MSGRVCHIIVAAGSGSRFGGDLPKQFCMFAGRPLLMTTIDNIRAAEGDDVLLVLSAQMVDFWRELCKTYSYVSPKVVTGGATRWESVKNAISALPGAAAIVTIHDGARPLAGADIMARVVGAVRDGHQGAIPVTPLTDSIRRVLPGGRSECADRDQFRCVQTPQAFDAKLLLQAYQLPYRESFTDDASVMEAAEFTDIVMVDGDHKNIKVTNPDDIEIAEVYARRMKR